jgi:phosphoribosylformylglycinamidine cyclo-ligase
LHTDGVGTKVLVAEACHKYDTIGIDCVAMNVNDILCLGAEPLALVDYLAVDKPRPAMVKQVMVGLQRGAREAGVAVVGGETAVMPDVVKGFDLAATVVGLVKKSRIVTGEETQPGDVILGLRSSGIHSNGLTLARKLLLSGRTNPRILRELLRPTRIYVSEITKLLNSGLKIHGLAHITGGAYSKLKRIGTRANVGFFFNNMPKPSWIFQLIQDRARISDREMYCTFNMGIGFLAMCPRVLERRAVALVPELRQVGFVTDTRNVRVRVGNRVVEIERW